MTNIKNMNNNILDNMFNMMNNRSLMSLALTNKEMLARIMSYLRRTKRSSKLLFELTGKLAANHREAKKRNKRPRNNNNNNGRAPAPRKIVF